MQLGIRLHDVKPAPLEERLVTAREQGFVCAHVALSKVISEYPVSDSTLTPGYACYLKNLFARNQIDIAVLGCYLNLGNPNQKSLKETQKHYLAHIRFASLLGCGVVGTETGAVNESYSFEEANHSDQALQIFINNLRPLVEAAEKMGVILAIEPVYRHIVYSPERARTVLDTIGSPNLQIIFDPVNMLEMCNYQNREEIFGQAIDLLGDDIAVVHLKDFVIEDNKLKSVAAGTGEMDYGPILRFMKEKKPFIHATLEDSRPDNAVFARKYIQERYDACRIG